MSTFGERKKNYEELAKVVYENTKASVEFANDLACILGKLWGYDDGENLEFFRKLIHPLRPKGQIGKEEEKHILQEAREYVKQRLKVEEMKISLKVLANTEPAEKLARYQEVMHKCSLRALIAIKNIDKAYNGEALIKAHYDALEELTKEG